MYLYIYIYIYIYIYMYMLYMNTSGLIFENVELGKGAIREARSSREIRIRADS